MRVVVIGATVYAGPIDRELHLLDYMTGRLLVRSKIPHATGGTVMTVDGQIYFAGNGAIDCFGLDGQLRWSTRFDENNNTRSLSLAVPGLAVQGDLR
jgi:outer membrane protein assembly factor BamB